MRYIAAAILWSISSFAQTPVKPEDKCSIEGTVVNAATGEPVKQTRLILVPVGTTKKSSYGTTSDAAGHFLIDEVDAGRYDLQAFRSGYPYQDYSPKGAAGRVGILTLESGQKLKEIVFNLTPQAVISGHILDEDDDPLGNVTVECMRFGYEQGKRELYGGERAVSNDLGEFRLLVSRARKCVIRATFQSRGTIQFRERPIGTARSGAETYAATYYPNTANPNNASWIQVAAGAQVSGINLTLQRSRTVRIRGHVNAGIATNSRQTGVTLSSPDNSRAMDTMVDPKGGFQLDGVLPGSYFLHASCNVGEQSYTARMPIEVSEADIEGVELTLQPPAEIHGRVILEGKDELANIVPALVVLSRATYDGRLVQVRDDLTFKVENLPPDTYEFRKAPRMQSFYVKSVRWGQQDVTETGLEVTPGAGTEDVTVVLSSNSGVVEGSVRNAKGEPANGSLITLIPADGRHYKIAYADQNGGFTIKGVVPGKYKIYAWEGMEEDAYEDPDFIKPHESEGEAVSIKEGGHESVRLKSIPAENTAAQKPAAQ